MSTTPTVIAFDARYVNDHYHGIGRYAYNLLEALTRLDQQRRYLVFYHPGYPNTRFPLTNLQKRTNVALRPVRLPLYMPGEQLIWPFLLACEKVRIFHTPYIVLPLLARTRRIMTIHDLILERYPEYRPRSLLQRFYTPVTRLSLSRAHRIFTLSQATGLDVQDYYRANSAHLCVIGSGLDPAFHPAISDKHKKAVSQRYSLPERFILTVGAGRPHKNVEVLVEAFAHLALPEDVQLIIGGERDTRFPDSVGDCIRHYHLEQHVRRPGMIPEEDLPALYTLAEVFVFPSLIEGFGFPPLEAMACGTPVLASTAPAVAEAVGEAALQFDPHDVGQLERSLQRVLSDSDLRSALIARGHERVRTFAWERVVQMTCQAYSELEG